MNKKNNLEGLTTSEIREMIRNGKLSMASLDVGVLQKLMDYETAMLCFDEGDVDFISKCADILSEKETGLLSHESFMSVVNKTLDKQAAPVRKGFSLKRGLIVAAAVATLVIASTIVTSAMNVDLMALARKALGLPAGTKWDENGFTVENGGRPRNYSSIQEMLEGEKIDIMYPTLPEGVEVDRIIVSEGASYGDKTIVILTKSRSVCINIITNVPPAELTYEGQDVYEKGDIKYILLDGPEGYRYSANAVVDNCIYDIQTKEYEDLVFIIENMEENKK